jgi:cytosine/adenosine deaminase-related metal-dependent hydrolase
VLDNWQRYKELGINIALGSDTYPRDMMLNMRMASYLGKIMSHNYKSATAADVYSAATLGGRAFARPRRLGRLAPGARAGHHTDRFIGARVAAHGNRARSRQDRGRMRCRR